VTKFSVVRDHAHISILKDYGEINAQISVTLFFDLLRWGQTELRA
jgi:hypothetical protein